MKIVILFYALSCAEETSINRDFANFDSQFKMERAEAVIPVKENATAELFLIKHTQKYIQKET